MGIYNLSEVELNQKELNILNLGLKCTPKKTMNKFEVYIDTKKFVCTLSMKKYFLSHPAAPKNRVTTPSDKVDSGLKNKSIFNPQNSNNHFIEVFKNLVLRDIEQLTVKKRVNPDYIKDGIKSLEERKNIVRLADKRGGVVIMDKTFYDKQLIDLLGNQST